MAIDNEINNHIKVPKNKDTLLNEINDVKRNPYFFLILLVLPFCVYLIPSNKFIGEEENFLIYVALYFIYATTQAELYRTNKKLKLLVEIVKIKEL